MIASSLLGLIFLTLPNLSNSSSCGGLFNVIFGFFLRPYIFDRILYRIPLGPKMLTLLEVELF